MTKQKLAPKKLAKKWFFEFEQGSDEDGVSEFRVRTLKDPGVWVFDVWDSFGYGSFGRWVKAGWVARAAVDKTTTLKWPNVMSLHIANHPWASPIEVSPDLAKEMLVAYDAWCERCQRA